MVQPNIRNRRPTKDEPLYDWLNDDEFWDKEVTPPDLALARYDEDEHLLYIRQKSYDMKVPPVVLNSVVRAAHQPEEAVEFFSDNYTVSYRNTIGDMTENQIYDRVREENRLSAGKQPRNIVRADFLMNFIECLNLAYNFRWSDSRRDFLQGSLLVTSAHRGKMKIYVEEGYNQGTNHRRTTSINPFGQAVKFVAGDD